jgi:hypothetical protein
MDGSMGPLCLRPLDIINLEAMDEGLEVGYSCTQRSSPRVVLGFFMRSDDPILQQKQIDSVQGLQISDCGATEPSGSRINL